MSNVSILSQTMLPLEVIYTAFKNCYSPLPPYEIMANALVTKREALSGEVLELLKTGHDSPIEHASITFAVDGVSRTLTHQLVRHRIASYSQKSQRYVKMGAKAPLEYIVPASIARIPEANDAYIAHMEATSKLYTMLAEHVLAEDARYVLPNAVTTSIVFTMNYRTLLNFFGLRCCMRAQWEIRDMANQMLKLAKEQCAVVFTNAGARCETLNYCPELKKFSCGKYGTKEELRE